MFHLKGVEGTVLTWQDLAISSANLPWLWLVVFNRFLGRFEILHVMFLVQEFFWCLLSLLPAVQHLERSTHASAGAPTTLLFCDATALLGPWSNREMVTILP